MPHPTNRRLTRPARSWKHEACAAGSLRATSSSASPIRNRSSKRSMGARSSFSFIPGTPTPLRTSCASSGTCLANHSHYPDSHRGRAAVGELGVFHQCAALARRADAFVENSSRSSRTHEFEVLLPASLPRSPSAEELAEEGCWLALKEEDKALVPRLKMNRKVLLISAAAGLAFAIAFALFLLLKPPSILRSSLSNIQQRFLRFVRWAGTIEFRFGKATSKKSN